MNDNHASISGAFAPPWTLVPLLLSAALGLMVLASGCASIFNGSSQMVEVESTPSGAAVWLDGRRLEQTTPTSIPLERGCTNHVVRVQKEGYAPVETVLTPHYSLWLGADIGVCFTGVGLVPGMLGLVVDLGTGTGFTHSPEAIDVRLNALRAPSASSVPKPERPASKRGKAGGKPPAEGGGGPPAGADELPPEIRKSYDGVLKMRDEGVISQEEFGTLERLLLERH